VVTLRKEPQIDPPPQICGGGGREGGGSLRELAEPDRKESPHVRRRLAKGRKPKKTLLPRENGKRLFTVEVGKGDRTL